MAKIMKISKFENIDFNSISTIIFDWGGVLTNIHPEATIDALARLGHHTFKKYLSADKHNDLFLRLETGKADETEVYSTLRKDIGKHVSKTLLNKALCAMLLDTPLIRFRILEKLSKIYRLILLSNTNSIHVKFYTNYLYNKHRIDFRSYFNKVYYSYELGMRKPDREIFEFVLNDAKLDGHKTLFIDDTEINIQVARSLDIQCLHLTHDRSIETIFFFL
jgi:putative hydrolase of the HAD superfamily